MKIYQYFSLSFNQNIFIYNIDFYRLYWIGSWVLKLEWVPSDTEDGFCNDPLGHFVK